jgi:hypothetical protein
MRAQDSHELIVVVAMATLVIGVCGAVDCRFTAVRIVANGTEPPFVRYSVANGGKADNICSQRVFPLLTRSPYQDTRLTRYDAVF